MNYGTDTYPNNKRIELKWARAGAMRSGSLGGALLSTIGSGVEIICHSRNSRWSIDMSAEVKKEIQLEIGHVLFIDIVSYSKLSVDEQRAPG